MIGNGIAQKIIVGQLLTRLLLISNHHANVCSGGEGCGDKKKNGGSHACTKCRCRMKYSNAKSAVGDKQRLVRPTDEILAKAASKKFCHTAFAMCAKHDEVEGTAKLIAHHLANIT